jgi:hypothetical protein
MGNPKEYVAAATTVPDVLSVACTVPLVTVPVFGGDVAVAEELLASTATTPLATITAPRNASSTRLPVIHLLLLAIPFLSDRTLTKAQRADQLLDEPPTQSSAFCG